MVLFLTRIKVKNTNFLIILFLLFFGIVNSSDAIIKNLNIVRNNDNSCRDISDNSGDNWHVLIAESGTYCLTQNLYQSWPFIRLPHQPVPKAPLVSIYKSNIEVDVKGHHLSAKTLSGIGVYVMGTMGISNTPVVSIKIKNGIITTSKEVTIVMTDGWNDENTRFNDSNFAISNYSGDVSQYRPTDFILENLTLEADNHVIIMQGMRNIIRHCKIIGGNGTVNLYGPNLIFEDNEIILTATDAKDAKGEPPVALYLEDAANSVIRNNRIVIEGRTSIADAIVLKNSINVKLEGNTVIGARQLYRLLDATSSVSATSNNLKPATAWWHWPSFD